MLAEFGLLAFVEESVEDLLSLYGGVLFLPFGLAADGGEEVRGGFVF